MKPKKFESVKITLKQNIVISGIVEVWTQNKIVLDCNGDKLIIPDVTQVLFFIINQRAKKIDSLNNTTVNNLSIEQRISESSKSLAELKIEQNKIDRELLSDKLKDLTFSKIGGSNYGLPNISKIKVSE